MPYIALNIDALAFVKKKKQAKSFGLTPIVSGVDNNDNKIPFAFPLILRERKRERKRERDR